MNSSHIDSLLSEFDVDTHKLLADAPVDYQDLVFNRWSDYASRSAADFLADGTPEVPLKELFVALGDTEGNDSAKDELAGFNSLVQASKQEALNGSLRGEVGALAEGPPKSPLDLYLESKAMLLLAFSLNLGVFGLKKLTGEAIDGSETLLSLVGIRQVLEKMAASQKAFETRLEDAELLTESKASSGAEQLRPHLLEELAAGAETNGKAQRRALRMAVEEVVEKRPAPVATPPSSERKKLKKIAKSAYLSSVAKEPAEFPHERDLHGRQLSRDEAFATDYEERHLRRRHAGKKQLNQARERSAHGERVDDFTELNDLKNIFGGEGSARGSKRQPRRNAGKRAYSKH